MRQRWIVPTLALLVVTGTIGAAVVLRAPRTPELHGTLLDPPLAAGDFELTGGDGPVRLSGFRGKLVVLFFGFTHCPDVCPTTMQRLGNAVRVLGPRADEVQVLLVSVDPERDTPDRVSRYAAGFHPSFIGLTGTPEQIAEVASGFGIYYARAEAGSDAGYLVDHSASVLVVGREGGVRLIWPFEVGADEMAADLRALLRER